MDWEAQTNFREIAPGVSLCIYRKRQIKGDYALYKPTLKR